MEKRLSSHYRDLTMVEKQRAFSRKCSEISCNGYHRADVVDFLHRTVIDFLSLTSVYKKLTILASKDFDPYAALCESRLITLKVFPWSCHHVYSPLYKTRLSCDA